LLLSLVYRKVTCDISKSKKPVTDFSLSFQARSETGANRQRNDLGFEIRDWEGLGVWDVWMFGVLRFRIKDLGFVIKFL
jgi:hypothetical protein